MTHKVHQGCRELWVQVVWQAMNEAKSRLKIAANVKEGHHDCQILNDWARIRPYDHELSRIDAYFRSQDFRDICLWASLPCDPDAAIAFATGEWSERVAA